MSLDFWRLSGNLSISPIFMGIKLFLEFPYYYSNICGFFSDLISSIPDIGKLCLLSFFLPSLTRDLSILLFFLKNQLFGFNDSLYCIFCFQYYSFTSFSLLFPSLCLLLFSFTLLFLVRWHINFDLRLLFFSKVNV